MQIPIHILLIVGLMFGTIPFANSVAVDDTFAGEIVANEGDSVTLTCDLRGTNASAIWFRNPIGYVTFGESFTPNFPEQFVNRLSINCSDDLEACYLSINLLHIMDAGEYGCGYQTEDMIMRRVSYGQLVVQVPPTGPRCVLYDRLGNPISTDMAHVGDRIAFDCIINGGIPRPFVYIDLEGVAITARNRVSFTKHYTLSEEDQGKTFNCVVTHPALSQASTCSLLTLKDNSTDSQTSS